MARNLDGIAARVTAARMNLVAVESMLDPSSEAARLRGVLADQLEPARAARAAARVMVALLEVPDVEGALPLADLAWLAAELRDLVEDIAIGLEAREARP